MTKLFAAAAFMVLVGAVVGVLQGRIGAKVTVGCAPSVNVRIVRWAGEAAGAVAGHAARFAPSRNRLRVEQAPVASF